MQLLHEHQGGRKLRSLCKSKTPRMHCHQPSYKSVCNTGDSYLNFMGNEFGHPEWIDFPRGDSYDNSTNALVPGMHCLVLHIALLPY